jgi:hypothetical protein
MIPSLTTSVNQEEPEEQKTTRTTKRTTVNQEQPKEQQLIKNNQKNNS